MFRTFTLLSALLCMGKLNEAAVDQKHTNSLVCFPFLYANKPSAIQNIIPPQEFQPNSDHLSRYYIIPHTEFESFFRTALGNKCPTPSDLSTNELIMEENVPWDPACDKFSFEARQQIKKHSLIYKWVEEKDAAARAQLLADEMCSPDAIQTYFLWLPGNIFIGPKGVYRSDRVLTSKFESGARFLLSDADYRDLVYLNTTMPAFVRGMNSWGQPFTEQQKDDLLKNIISVLNKLQDKSPHPFSESQWVVENQVTRRIKT